MAREHFKLDLSPLGRVGKWCLAGAAIVGGYGCYRLLDTATLVTRGRPVSARVFYTDHRAWDANDPLDEWHKEARYSTWAYRTVVFRTDQGRRIVDQPCVSWHHFHRDGLIAQKVVPRERAAQVLYDPDQPTRWLFDDGWSLWGFPISCVSTAMAWFFYAAAVGFGWIRPPSVRLRFRVARPLPTGSGCLPAAQQS